jgi:Arc/MetJ family transcription regulator
VRDEGELRDTRHRRRTGRAVLLESPEMSGLAHGARIPYFSHEGYTDAVIKTTIQFDPAKRDAVAAVLGTKGLKATVDAAFDVVLRQHAGRELVRLVHEGGIELTNEQVERRAWGD